MSFCPFAYTLLLSECWWMRWPIRVGELRRIDIKGYNLASSERQVNVCPEELYPCPIIHWETQGKYCLPSPPPPLFPPCPTWVYISVWIVSQVGSCWWQSNWKSLEFDYMEYFFSWFIQWKSWNFIVSWELHKILCYWSPIEIWNWL